MQNSLLVVGLPALLFVSSLARPASACDCAETPPFLIAAAEHALVVVARVESNADKVMELAVEQTLLGVPEKRVRVWEGKGFECRALVEPFAVGTRWVVMLRPDGQTSPPSPAGAPLPQYFIPLCGITSLAIEGDSAVGDIEKGVKRMPLAELAKRLTAQQERGIVRDAAALPRFVNQWFLLEGVAGDAKGGAVVQVGGTPVYVEGQAAWPAADLGRTVVMQGIMIDAKLLPDPRNAKGAIVQGAEGTQLVLKGARRLR